MTDLITEARELATENISQPTVFYKDKSQRIMLRLCDALEKAQEQNKQLLHEVCKLACESVEREKNLARMEAEVMAACNSVRWVPVTDRLPKTEKPVQVYMPKLYMSVQTGFYTKYYGEDDGEWYEHWVASGDVTHWRELPAPPEEGAEHERD
jgi:hypothetical protein